MFKFLLDTEQGYISYIFKSLFLILGIALPIAFLLYSIFPNADTVAADFKTIGTYIVIGAPIIETTIMLIIFKIIQIFTDRLSIICLVSALTWAILHSLVTPLHGIIIFSSFLIYSIAFKVWEKRSVISGFLVVVVIHTLNNLSGMLISIYG